MRKKVNALPEEHTIAMEVSTIHYYIVIQMGLNRLIGVGVKSAKVCSRLPEGTRESVQMAGQKKSLTS